MNSEELENAKSERKYSTHCYFCVNKITFSYKELLKIKRFLNERDMIVSRQKSRLCAYHQRKLAEDIKKARYLALLPTGGRRNLG